jgi:hypothetical protein
MAMTSHVADLQNALEPLIESKVRLYCISNDQTTPYPGLNGFAQALAEALAPTLISFLQSYATITLTNAPVGAGSFNVPAVSGIGLTPVTGSGTLTATVGLQ